MIIVRITSGLGNQLFQYATAKNLAIKHKTVLKIDRINYFSDRLRSFELDWLNADLKFVTTRDLLGIYPAEGFALCLLRPLIGRKKAARLLLWYENRIRHFQSEYNKPFAHTRPLMRKRVLIQRYYHYDEEISGSPDNIYLIGYFQSWKYFDEIRDELIRELQPPDSPEGENREILSKIEACNSVAVHVRRGDYFSIEENRRLFGVYDMGYFHNAIEMISKKIPNPVFFVFSDDIDWVRKNLVSDQKMIYVGNNRNNPAEDLRLMYSCRHDILSNSSFSWWGAWLNQNKDKIVIAPEKWLSDEEYDTSDLIPPGWIRL